MRIGHGVDVHQLVEGRPLILGGITVPHHLGLLGHSDADVLTHAIIDALLGALAQGTIGDHFPDTDPLFKDADSLVLLDHVLNLVQSEGYRIGNIDATLLAQKPKLMPFVPQIRACLSDRLGIPIKDLSVKATTTESLGFEGRQEGITCHAVVLLIPR